MTLQHVSNFSNSIYFHNPIFSFSATGQTVFAKDECFEENWRGQVSTYNNSINKKKAEIELRPNAFTVMVGDQQQRIYYTCAANSIIHGLLKLAQEMSIEKNLKDKTKFFQLVHSIIECENRESINYKFYTMIMSTNLKNFVSMGEVGINFSMTIENFIENSFPQLINKSCLKCKSKKSFT
jgi:hypothetical protein